MDEFIDVFHLILHLSSETPVVCVTKENIQRIEYEEKVSTTAAQPDNEYSLHHRILAMACIVTFSGNSPPILIWKRNGNIVEPSGNVTIYNTSIYWLNVSRGHRDWFESSMELTSGHSKSIIMWTVGSAGGPINQILKTGISLYKPYILNYFTLMPIRSQIRADLAFSPAAAWASVHSCRRSAVVTVLDHKSPGVREFCIIGHLNRCLVLWSCSLHNGQSGDG